jgi:hypothetical protein
MNTLFTVRPSRVTDPNTFKMKTIFIVTDTGPVWQAITPGSASSEYEQIIAKRTYCSKEYVSRQNV